MLNLNAKETTLQDGLEQFHKMCKNQGAAERLPWLIKILENPKSPVALPGAVSLDDHDVMHVLLGMGIDPCHEAFVIGFTMGGSEHSKWQIDLFLWLAGFYPGVYKFQDYHRAWFMIGYHAAEVSGFSLCNLTRITNQRRKDSGFYIKPIDIQRHFLDVDMGVINGAVKMGLNKKLPWNTVETVNNKVVLKEEYACA
jgi:hypothetical protein